MATEIQKKETRSTPAPQRYADPFEALRAELDRVFDGFLGGGWRLPRLTGAAGGGEMAVVPRMDVRETPEAIHVEAELPGIDEKDVAITLQNGVLNIRGEKKSERKEEKDDYHLTERSYGSFHRAFSLPDTVDENKVAAAFEKGVLKVTLPKRAEAVKPEKRIEIKKG